MSTNNNDNNITENLLTRVWGPHMWIALHSITFGYPHKPSEETQKHCLIFFKNLGNLLPCSYCRESYKEMINENDTLLNEDVVKNTNTLSRWLYNIHQKVNKKLGVDYGVTYEEVVERYDSYRAKCSKDTANKEFCSIPIKQKAQSYTVADLKDCPIIPYEIAKSFSDYAHKRGVYEMENLDHYYYLSKNRKSEDWKKRNQECTNIIKNMRKEGISSIEQDGEWKGYPSIEELKLISHMSATLNINELLDIIKIKKLKNNNIQKVYKLIK
ncbi:MAG: Erv1/Alr family disulfide thiol oxidoreductase [Edafosvirus sp.]|uniref:Sulfhydryl oxidase n=1 Tax=Edafosvirus sp. TaxID=2487765 RepID=A0A3G4ZZK3_9VIRU|nr:MAG: Erv1/Alr family disulfide thiol oxidoreductase [Edafosvirus sp.]